MNNTLVKKNYGLIYLQTNQMNKETKYGSDTMTLNLNETSITSNRT